MLVCLYDKERQTTCWLVSLLEWEAREVRRRLARGWWNGSRVTCPSGSHTPSAPTPAGFASFLCSEQRMFQRRVISPR